MIVSLKEYFDVNKNNNCLENKHSVHVEWSRDSFIFIDRSSLMLNEMYVNLVPSWFVQSRECYEQKNPSLNDGYDVLVPK